MNLRSGSTKVRISCKSGSEWGEEDLDFFCISILEISSFEEFFQHSKPHAFVNNDINELLAQDISGAIVQRTIDWASIRSHLVRTVIKDIIAVTKTHRSEESAVDDLAKSLLQLFEYDRDDNSIRTREVLNLEMSKARTQAIPDICIETTELSIKLLVQEDKNYNYGNNRMTQNPEAQLVAEAVAAFQENVRTYKRLGRRTIPSSQLIPGIIMLGTCPTFYQICVTSELADCVKRGEQPGTQTTVKKYIIEDLPINISDVMLSSLHARYIAECYESFRSFL